MSGDPSQAAKNWWNDVQKTILSAEGVDYWEGTYHVLQPPGGISCEYNDRVQ